MDTRIPSPAASLNAKSTPLRRNLRRIASAGSPICSIPSNKVLSVRQDNHMESHIFSPLKNKSILSDNTDITGPGLKGNGSTICCPRLKSQKALVFSYSLLLKKEKGGKSWWKRLEETSNNIIEVQENNEPLEIDEIHLKSNNIIQVQAKDELIDSNKKSSDILQTDGNSHETDKIQDYLNIETEILSQGRRSNTIELPEISEGESVPSIVIPQRKLFTQHHNQLQIEFTQLNANSESLDILQKSEVTHYKTIEVGKKDLFNRGIEKKGRPLSGLFKNPSLNETVNNTSKELHTQNQVRNIFGNRKGTKHKNMFAKYIVSESDDDLPNIVPKIFSFPKRIEQQRRRSSASQGLGNLSSTTNMTDIDIEDWKLLPSSTMVDNQLDLDNNTPIKRSRHSQRVEGKEIIVNEIGNTRKEINSSIASNDLQNKSSNINDITNKELIKSQSLTNITPNTDKNEKDIVLNDLQKQDKDDQDKQIKKAMEDENKTHKIYCNENETVITMNQNNKSLEENKEAQEHDIEQQKNKDFQKNNEYKNSDNFENNQANQEDSQINLENDKRHEICTEIKQIEMQIVYNNIPNDDEGEGLDRNNTNNLSIQSKNESTEKHSKENKGIKILCHENEILEDRNEVQEQHMTEHEKQNVSEQEEDERIEHLCHESESLQETPRLDEQDMEEHEKENESEQEDDRIQYLLDENRIVEDTNDTQQATKSNEEENNKQQNYEKTEKSIIYNSVGEHEQDENENPTNHDSSNKNHKEHTIDHSNNVRNLQKTDTKHVTLPSTSAKENFEQDVEPLENILDYVHNQQDSFKADVRNSTFRRTKSVTKLNTLKANFSPLRESIESDNATKDSSCERSGWDSHRTTRKTLRQTFGKDFTPRKSLRSLVMEKAAKRQTYAIDVTAKDPKACSTKLHEHMDVDLSEHEDSGDFNNHNENNHREVTNNIEDNFQNSESNVSVNPSISHASTNQSITNISSINQSKRNVSVNQNTSTIFDDLTEESDHEASRIRQQEMRKAKVQKVKEENVKELQQIREKVLNSMKVQPRYISHINFAGAKQALHLISNMDGHTKPKAKRVKSSLLPTSNLPPDVLQVMNYKPPKRYRPKKASWATKRLYKYLETKLEPKYNYKARVQAEKLVEAIYNFVMGNIRRCKVAPFDEVDLLKRQMARLNIVRTHHDFYEFIHEYLPREVRVKVVPDIVNKIPMPRDVFSDILQ